MRISLTLSALFCLTISCSPKSTINYLAPQEKEKKVVDGNTSDVFDPKVDILFVVDDSGSMNVHQDNLAQNITGFTSVFLNNSVLDYNIGVITTSDSSDYRNCCGQLVGTPSIVTKRTPDSDIVLQRNLKVGINGHYYETPFATTARALEPGILAPGGHNAGFIRSNAGLIIIFITDAEDQSEGLSAHNLMDQLLVLKNHDMRRILSYGAIVPTGDSSCKRDSYLETPLRIEEFLDIVPNGKTGGGKGENIVNLCDADFGKRLAEFALEIVDQVGSTIYLSRRPDPETLRVTYGSIDLPRDTETGWYFRPSTNAVYLGPRIDWSSQPEGSKIEVHYNEARGDD